MKKTNEEESRGFEEERKTGREMKREGEEER